MSREVEILKAKIKKIDEVLSAHNECVELLETNIVYKIIDKHIIKKNEGKRSRNTINN